MPKARRPENVELPQRWTLQHGAYYYRVPTGSEHLWNGKKMYRLGKTVEEAQAVFRHFQEEGSAPIRVEDARNFRFKAGLWEKLGYKKSCGIPLSILQGVYISARSSAPKRWLTFSLHPKHLIDLANKSGGACMLTNIKWDMKTTAKTRRPWMPSLDRIDSMKGYEPDNIRLVCLSVNIALHEFGDKVLMKIACGIIKNCDTGPLHNTALTYPQFITT